MLLQIRIKNIGLVEDQVIDFRPGFNVITGETGAGKSMTVSAVTLLSGERISSNILKDGSEQGGVEGLFDLENRFDLVKELQDKGIEVSDNQLIIKREIFANGKNRCFINGSPATLAQIKQIGDKLIDIHGPHDHQSLLKSSQHIMILDNYGDLNNEKKAYGDIYRNYTELLNKRRRLIEEEADESMADFISYQLQEIEQASLSEDEEEELLKEEKLLSNFAELSTYAKTASGDLYEKDNSLIEGLSDVKKSIEKISEVEDRFKSFVEVLEEALVNLKEVAEEIRNFTGALDYDPVRLQEIEDRLTVINKLKRKYNGTVAEILEKKEYMRTRLDAMQQRDVFLQELDKNCTAIEKRLSAEAAVLSAKRHSTAQNLSRNIEVVLNGLGMNDAKFEVHFETIPFSENGVDNLEFYISTNVGQAVKPLKDVASSGEISRIMLAIKKIIATTDAVPIMVFDEIDVNIGGKTAEIVGERMKEIARNHQLLVISHLPQIAVKADNHFIVSKDVKDGVTLVTVRTVSGDERVEEIARMLGGAELTSVTVDHARELLNTN